MLDRTTPSPPFSSTGVDFAGPFTLRMGYTRKPVLIKTYACVFICLTTRAIHIELCSSLEADEFRAAFQRFCARRGCPTNVYSDNGTNFVGTFNEIQEIQQLLDSSKNAISSLYTHQPLHHSCQLFKSNFRDTMPHPNHTHLLQKLIINCPMINNCNNKVYFPK